MSGLMAGTLPDEPNINSKEIIHRLSDFINCQSLIEPTKNRVN